MRALALPEQFLRDLRFGLYNLFKTPGFAVSAILSLALGIGATTSIFSVIYGVIIDPFPYSHPETLFSFRVSEPDSNFYFYPGTPDQYLDIEQQNHVFSDVIASTISDVFWTGTGKPQRLRGNFTTVNTFQVLGVKPLAGRYILPSDGSPSAPPVAVLGYKFWQRQFAGDPHVIGRNLRLNDKVRTIVGIMPRRFMWRGADVYLPIVFKRGQFVEGVRQAFIMGRLKPGATAAQAATDLHPIFEEMMNRRPGRHITKFRVQLSDFYDTFPSGIRRSLWILFGAVTLLLLIACTNVSSLLLARSAARGREIAIRAALGAGRFRIVRQLLTESALIGLGAGVLGVLLAYGSLNAILAIVPPNTIPDESVIALNVPVLLFTLGISLAAAFLFGLMPALETARTNIADSLRSAGRGSSGARRETRLRNILVSAEIALAMILLVGASLVSRTLLQLERFQPSVNPDDVLTMVVPLPERRYPTRESRNAFFVQALDRTQSIPGIKRVSLNSFIHPFANFGSTVQASGAPLKTRTEAVVSEVSQGYTPMLGDRLLQGRLFSEDDVRAARQFALVNEKFAKAFFPAGGAVGRSIRLPDLHEPPQNLADDSFQIIGVVGDIRNLGLERDLMPEVYIPFTTTGFVMAGSATLIITANVPVETLVNPIEARLHSIDPDQPVMEVRTMREMLDAFGYSAPRFSVFLFGIFSGLGLFLAALGIYAVINYSVVRQTQDIGIRMALGAQRSTILKMVIRSGVKLIAAGAAAGLIASLCLTQFLRGMIWHVSPFDPISFIAVIVLLTVIGVLACIRPALRASRIDPITALRYE